MRTIGTVPSTSNNVNDDIAGGRKTLETATTGTTEGGVLVNVDASGDAIVFADEMGSVPSLESEDSEDSDYESEEESDEEEEDVEFDEFLAERRRILGDARALKSLAVVFLHPEAPVNTSDGAAFGRNYFNRASAPEVEDDEFADERAEVLAEAAALKQLAVDYMHPEVGVTSTDGAAFGRNYFTRASAPDVEDIELADERAEVLAEAAALKKLAVDYFHPEVGVTSVDGAAFGRNYFNRASAPDTEDDEFADERAEVLAEAAALKQLAVDYLHPEVGVTSTDGAAFGRNYFNRASAPDVEDIELADERAAVLAEAAALKQLAVDYLHPEVGVASTDGAAFGRNYFNRASAPDVEDIELADERAAVLAEAAALKQLAVDYLHPEVGVASTDGAAFGRNYFNRASAPDTEDDEFADERAEVLAEAAALKKLAVDYLHPEVGVNNTDGAAFGRNYFNRASAPDTEDDEFADERAEVLAEAAALKKLAVDYLHPEVGVTSTDGAAFGRNYFNRASAPDVEDIELADERAAVLAEASALKKLAVDYLHPEVGVTSVDGSLFGRNYFTRASAPDTEDDEFADERAEVLAEAAALKKLAVDYLHPEVGVTSVDGAAFGRNYFNRASAPDVEDIELANERAAILAEVASLKKLAVDYLHPEVGVTSVDGAAFGRNYFNRASAPDVEDSEAAEERAAVLAEVAALKKLAVDYLHPEVGVTNTDGAAFGRNYFSRASAPDVEDIELANERAAVLAEAASLKKLAVDYLHPEVGVTSTDGACFGRNYFNRASAPETEVVEAKPEESSTDTSSLQALAARVKGANLPSTKSSKLDMDNVVSNAAKKSASSVNLFGLSEE
eukprot:scaffold26904_cov74-Skeletonema_dohrnii-CCMP3373.AAC.1